MLLRTKKIIPKLHDSRQSNFLHHPLSRSPPEFLHQLGNFTPATLVRFCMSGPFPAVDVIVHVPAGDGEMGRWILARPNCPSMTRDAAESQYRSVSITFFRPPYPEFQFSHRLPNEIQTENDLDLGTLRSAKRGSLQLQLVAGSFSRLLRLYVHTGFWKLQFKMN